MNRIEKLMVALCFLISLIYALYPSTAEAETYNITLTTPYTEVEAGFTALLQAECVDSAGVNHEDNITFTVSGVAFTFSTYTDLYQGTVVEVTPTIIEYGVLGAFNDSGNGTSTGIIIQNVTVTWTTGTLDRLQSWFVTGDWLGAAFGEIFLVTGQVAGYTLILAIFSLGAYQYSGPYATFGIWLFGWGVFISQVHGLAQQMAVLLFTVGVGLALAKLINDRRTA